MTEWLVRLPTSEAVTLKPSQSIRGRMLAMKVGLKSISCCSSSASRKWRGKDCGDVLQALTAQVRKLTVRIFICGGTGCLGEGDGVLGKVLAVQDRVHWLGGSARVKSFLFIRSTLCMAFIFIDDLDLSYNDVLGCKGKDIHLIIRTSYNFYSKSTTRLESCRIADTAGFPATTAQVMWKIT